MWGWFKVNQENKSFSWTVVGHAPCFCALEMVSGLIIYSVGQCCIIRFLVKEKVKPAEIHYELNVQYGKEMLPCSSACGLYRKFSEDCKEIRNLLHVRIQPTAVCCVNICLMKELILGNKWIPVHITAFNSGMCVRSVETVIHEGRRRSCSYRDRGTPWQT